MCPHHEVPISSDRGRRCVRPAVKTVSLALLAATALSGPALASAGHDAAPPRSADAALPSDAQLWSQLSASRSSAIIGLKERDENRGIWKDKILIDGASKRRAVKAVAGVRGVSVLSRPGAVPTMTVKLSDRAALARVRRMSYVDYVEPLHVKLKLASPAGCGKRNFLEEADADGRSRQANTPGLALAIDPSKSDMVPWNFDHMRLRDAWKLAEGGRGVTVGVVDTGLGTEQKQLDGWTTEGEFKSGMSTGRTILKSGAGRWWEGVDFPMSDDRCSHGTRMLGTIAAPRDGRNIVGAAWQSNLISERFGDDVILGSNNAEDFAKSIDRIAMNGTARTVVAMALGRYGYLSSVADAIRRHPQMLFVAAAGTAPFGGCVPGSVYFPANMPEVVAATGLAPDSQEVSWQACSGPETDIAPVIGDVPATGLGPGQISTFGGSSDGTAVTAGIAALIWSRYPHFTVEQVRARLLATAERKSGWNTGAGNPNAHLAVGGLAGVSISGPTKVTRSASYTLTAVPRIMDNPNLSYRWSTNETTKSITVRAGDAWQGSQTVRVTVTDDRESPARAVSASHTASWGGTTCTRCVEP